MQNDIKKSTRLLIGSVVLAIMIILWFKGCGGDGDKVITIKTPEVKGTFAPVKPEHKVIDTNHIVNVNKKVFGQNLSKKELAFWKTEAERLFKENQEMDQAFMNANDSLQQIIYSQAIRLNTFNHKFDNDTISATVKGIVRGEIQSIKLDYKIKPRTIEVPKQKEVVFRMLGGVEMGATKEIDKFNVKVSAGFQNRKGNIISIGADTDQRFYLGYNFSIFSIKR
jgi:hypothetical protein